MIWLTVMRTAVILVAAQALLVAIAAALLPGRNIYKILIAVAFLTAPAVFLAHGSPVTRYDKGRSFDAAPLGSRPVLLHF